MAFAGAASWLPGQDGNSWRYRNSYGQERTTTIDRSVGSWSHYDDFANSGKLWVWAGTGNNSYFYSNRQVQKWFNFLKADQPNASYPDIAPVVSFGACNQGVAVTFAGMEDVVTPAGTFAGCAKIGFQTSCADAGLTMIWVAKGVGIVRYQHTTIAGPIDYNLVYAKVGATEYKEAHGDISIWGRFSETQITADVGAKVRGWIVITNDTTASTDFFFTSGKSFEIELLDSRGQVVTLWSNGMFFTQATRRIALASGDKLRFDAELPLVDASGAAIGAGRYTLRMYLAGSQNYGFQAPLTIVTP